MARSLRERALLRKGIFRYEARMRTSAAILLAALAASTVAQNASATTPCPGALIIPLDQPCPPSPWLLHFDWNSTALTPIGQHVLAAAAFVYRRLPDRGIVVTGHADRSGSDAYNLDLALRRATAVRTALVRLGIPASEIRIAAQGETRPAGSAADGVRDRRNRRVEIVLGADGRRPGG